MDFFQFLSIQNVSEPVASSSSQKTLHNQPTTPTPTTTVPTVTDRIAMYQDIRRGDFVKIISIPNSVLNTYKGYIGEIRDYRKNQDYALVFLHAIQTLRVVKFPLCHLVHYDPFTDQIC